MSSKPKGSNPRDPGQLFSARMFEVDPMQEIEKRKEPGSQMAESPLLFRSVPFVSTLDEASPFSCYLDTHIEKVPLPCHMEKQGIGSSFGASLLALMSSCCIFCHRLQAGGQEIEC